MVQTENEPQLLKLPCSRQEIFSNKTISLKDKRLLTKFIQYIVDHAAKGVEEAKEMNDVSLKQGRSLTRPQNKAVMIIDLQQYQKVPFTDFLEKEFHITGILRDMIMSVSFVTLTFSYSICLSGSTETILTDSKETPFIQLTTEEGIQRVEEFITSLNIYGSTPFLYPVYGGGDILQSFCRINNVYGGITMLQTEVVRLVVKKSTECIVGVEVCNDTTNRIIRCKNVIASDDYSLSEKGQPCKVTHGVYIVEGNNKGKKEDESKNELYDDKTVEMKELRDLVVIPGTEEHRAVYLLIVCLIINDKGLA